MSITTNQSRAYRLQKLTGLSGLEPSTGAIPKPSAGEVLVRVRATALNFRDLLILEGKYHAPVRPNAIALSDAAGEIVDVGEGVTRFATGDRVTNSFFPDWIDGPYEHHYDGYSAQLDGWLTDYRVVPESALIHMPDNLSFVEAATLPCAAVTAWSALKGVQPGDTVLTQGSGGVSLFSIQFAKALGARVIATTSSDARRDQLIRVGASEVVNYVTHPEWSKQVRELTNGRGADRIVEVGGPGTFQESVKAVAMGGQVTMVGVLAGLIGTIDFMSMFMSQARYQPIALGSRNDLETLIECVRTNDIHPVIDSLFKFDEAKLAYERLMTRNVFGKVVITH